MRVDCLSSDEHSIKAEHKVCGRGKRQEIWLVKVGWGSAFGKLYTVCQGIYRWPYWGCKENLKHENDNQICALKDNFGWRVKDRLEWGEIIERKLITIGQCFPKF